MKKLERGERRQALFFLSAGILLVIGVITAFVGLPFGDDKVEYTLKFTESIIGIDVGSPVRYKGVRYGSIRHIAVDPTDAENIIVTLAVEPDTPITLSTQARIASATFLGPYYIELTGTIPGSPALPPGSGIPADPSTLSKILKGSESLVANIDTLVMQLTNFLSEERQTLLWQTVDDLDALLVTGRDTLEQTGSDAHAALAAWQDLGERVNKLLERREQSILRMIDSLDQASARANQFLQSGRLEELSDEAQALMKKLGTEVERDGAAVRKYLVDNPLKPSLDAAIVQLEVLQKSVTSFADLAAAELLRVNQGDLSPLVSELRSASSALDDLLRMLRRNPRALLFGEKPPEVSVPEPIK